MAHYINTRQQGIVETIDQFDTAKEAREMLREYQISDRYGNYYISSRCTREWRKSEREHAKQMESENG